jgi:hypothetical protein
VSPAGLSWPLFIGGQVPRNRSGSIQTSLHDMNRIQLYLGLYFMGRYPNKSQGYRWRGPRYSYLVTHCLWRCQVHTLTMSFGMCSCAPTTLDTMLIHYMCLWFYFTCFRTQTLNFPLVFLSVNLTVHLIEILCLSKCSYTNEITQAVTLRACNYHLHQIFNTIIFWILGFIDVDASVLYKMMMK